MKHLRNLFPVLLVLAVAEVLAMVLIDRLGLEEGIGKILLDSVLLVLMSAPFLYYFLMTRHEALQKSAQIDLALQDAIGKKTRAEEMYRSILETTREGVWRLDADGRTDYVNRPMAEMLGYTVHEMLGRYLYEFLDDEGHAQTGRIIERRRQGIAEIHDLHFRRKDGSDLWATVNANPLMDKDGNFIGTQGMISNITDRKRMEADLLRSRDALEARVRERTAELEKANGELQSEIAERRRAERQLSQGLKMLAVLRQVDQSIIGGANAREIFGLVCDAIVKMGYWSCGVGLAEPDHTVRVETVRGFDEKSFADLDIRWDDTPQGNGPSGTAIRTGQRYVSQNILEDIRFAPWRDKAIEAGLRSMVSLPLKSPESEVFGVFHVYSEQVNRFSPEEIHDLETLAQQCSVAILSARRLEALRDAHQRLSFHVNRMPLAYIVWDVDFRVAEWNPAAERIFGWNAGEALGKHPYELIVPEDARPHVDKVWSKLIKGDESSYSLNANIRKDRKKITCEWFNTPLRDRSGTVTGALSMVHDVTEKTQLERQLQTAQRMEAVGTLAGGIAHDFNNALTGIVGFVELLRQRMAGDTQALHDLDEIMRCAERASTLTRQLLTYARRQVIAPVNMSLNAVISDLSKLVRKAMGENVEVKIASAGDLPTIRADRGQIEQVFMNLCLNARDAMPEGGTLLIETENVHLDEGYVRYNPYMRTGRYALLRVSDTGIGMDEKTGERVFEPFFTTKGPEKGTGLGLAMVFGIVKQHGGFIHLYSEPGKGTTFKVYLPAIEAPPDVVVELPREEAVRGGTETILLAEDEGSIRMLAERTLKELGYDVLSAPNGEEAIGIFRQNRKIVLAVLDLVMPVKGGKEAFEVMHRENPRLKAIFMSGYSSDAIHDGFVLKAGVPFLQKPFGPTIMARKIREVLDTEG